MDFLKLPFFREIEASQNILLAGCGGGYDIFCGLPLYFGLRGLGKTVHLANLSFSRIAGSTGRKLPGGMVEVNAQTQGDERYFPEMYLARWLASQYIPAPIYCLPREGVKPVAKAYAWLAETLNIDTILLVDGGTDSLMRGDEVELGTPEEDSVSIAAVDQTDVARKMLVCLGFGIDTFHGVCHAQFLEAVGAVTRDGGFLGMWSLTQDMPEVQQYKAACYDTFRHMLGNPSIVSTSVLSAVEGRFGDYHWTQRTEGSKLFINALMTLYWAFRLETIARRNLYLDEIRETESFRAATNAIQAYRARNVDSRKDWQNLPM